MIKIHQSKLQLEINGTVIDITIEELKELRNTIDELINPPRPIPDGIYKRGYWGKPHEREVYLTTNKGLNPDQMTVEG